MFYLVSFLTMLVGFMIYLIDPVPNRQELNTIEGEAYIAAFVNQHQAARDYMYQWLGRISAFNKVGMGGSAASMEKYPNDTAPQAIAIPVSPFENTMPKGLTSEVRRTATDESVLSVNVGGEAGTYKSAVVCLSSGNLTPCYTCLAADGMTPVDCNNGKWVRDPNNTKRYVITYGKLPDWWEAQRGKRPMYQSLWRRALTRRTRASSTCGVLVASATGNEWVQSGYFKARRIKEENGNRNFCIDNGQRCASVVAPGIQDFLLNEAFNGQSIDDLDDNALVCISEIKNPYVTAGLQHHFDGVDNTAIGAPLSAFDVGVANFSYQWADRVDHRILVLNSNSSGRDMDLSFNPNGVLMPFNKENTDFTLSFVMKRDPAAPGNGAGAIVGPKGSGYYMEADGTDFIFGTGHNGQTFSTASFSPTIGGIPAANVIYSEGIHNWTIIRRADKMEFYLDGRALNFDESQPTDRNLWQAGNVAGAPAVQIGGASGTKFLDIKYYGRALSIPELKKNVRVDKKRYNITDNIETIIPILIP